MGSEDLFGAGRLDDVMEQVRAAGGEGFRSDHFMSREDNMAVGYLIAKGTLEICGGDGDVEPYYVRLKRGVAAVGRISSKQPDYAYAATNTIKKPEPKLAELKPVAEKTEPKKSMTALDHAREALQYIHTIAESLEAAKEAAGSGLRKMAGIETE